MKWGIKRSITGFDGPGMGVAVAGCQPAFVAVQSVSPLIVLSEPAIQLQIQEVPYGILNL